MMICSSSAGVSGRMAAGRGMSALRTRQILRSISDPKTTKLGTGRFWVIEVEYLNQDGELVGVESYTGFGYRRTA